MSEQHIHEGVRPHRELDATDRSLGLWTAHWAVLRTQERLETRNTQRHLSPDWVTSPGKAGQPGFGAKKVNIKTDVGCDFAELVQQNVQRREDAKSIGKKLGQVMDHGILAGGWEGKKGKSSLRCLGGTGQDLLGTGRISLLPGVSHCRQILYHCATRKTPTQPLGTCKFLSCSLNQIPSRC